MEPNIGYILADNSRLLRKVFDERVRNLGLTAAQARLLLSLEKFPDNNQAFYADRLEVEPITLCRIVDRMEESGWVERVADPTDRRARLLHLTGKSRNIVERLRQTVDGLVEDTLEGLGDAERLELARMLERIAVNLGADRTLPEVANG